MGLMYEVYDMKYISRAYEEEGIKGVLECYNECVYYQCFVLHHLGNISWDEFHEFIINVAADSRASLVFENMIASCIGVYSEDTIDDMHDNASVLITTLADIITNYGLSVFMDLIDAFPNKLYIKFILDHYKSAFDDEILPQLITGSPLSFIEMSEDKPYLNDITDIHTILNTMVSDWGQDVFQGSVVFGVNYTESIIKELVTFLDSIHEVILYYVDKDENIDRDKLYRTITFISSVIKNTILDTNFNTSPIVCVRGLMGAVSCVPSIVDEIAVDRAIYNKEWMCDLINGVITEMMTIDKKLYEFAYNKFLRVEFQDLIDDLMNTEHGYISTLDLIAMLEAYITRVDKFDRGGDVTTSLEEYLNIYYTVKDKIIFIETDDYKLYSGRSDDEISEENEAITKELNALDDLMMDWLL